MTLNELMLELKALQEQGYEQSSVIFHKEIEGESVEDIEIDCVSVSDKKEIVLK